MSKKNPGAAAVLSFCIPGLGQIYNGELGKGITVVAMSVIGWMLTCIFIGFIILIPLWVWSIYDAYSTAEQINTAVEQTN
jgi:TM2 domain-containing membrane protein YozV